MTPKLHFIKPLLVCATFLFLAACSSESKNEMIVQGQIKNLIKGTVYLQKIHNDNLQTVDSMVVEGDDTYKLSTIVESPEIFYLSLNKDQETTIEFFGEAGTITINSNIDKFIYNATIAGSKTQKVLDEYTKIQSRFKDQNLDMIKEMMLALKAGDSAKAKEVEARSDKMMFRNFLFTTNFALNNKDSEVAPYLALTRLSDANLKLLDTINNSLSVKVKKSTYGKALDAHIKKVKSFNN